MSWFKHVWKEFREFVVKGNAIDLAVGVIIGAAFSGIVNSLVKDIIVPPLSLFTGGSISRINLLFCERREMAPQCFIHLQMRPGPVQSH